MVQSTVGSSLANAITYLAGGKERDAALAGQLLQNQQRSALIRGQQLANDELQNQADLRAEREAVAPLVESGTIELNTDPDAVGAFKFNLDKSREGQVASLLNGSGALKTLNINTDEIEDLTFVDFAPAPGQRDNYVALVKNSSGEIVPMTVNGTNADGDPVMQFSRGQIERLMADRVAVLAQRGAFQNRSLSDAAATERHCRQPLRRNKNGLCCSPLLNPLLSSCRGPTLQPVEVCKMRSLAQTAMKTFAASVKTSAFRCRLLPERW